MSSIEERLARDIAAVTGGVVVTESDLRNARDEVDERIDGQRQRNRRRTAIAAAAAAVLILTLGVTALQTLGGNDETAPATPGPTTSDPEAGSDEFFATELRKTLAQVPDWTVTDIDPTILHPCGGDWSLDAIGAGGGSIGIGTPGGPPFVWSDGIGFPSAAQASDAAARLVENLGSCTAAAWRTQPIGQTGAVLASSAGGVMWIHQKGAGVATLQVPTTDGPPPLGVQVEVADLIWSSID
jgi:hypothetical protein